MRSIATYVVALGVALRVTAAVAAQSVSIHPSGNTVPENLLRIELRFAEPLNLPAQVGQVKLIDAGGHEIPEAFLDLALPSADGRRVTILLHPGRVKTGVGANLAFGRALHDGERVTLTVSHPSLPHPVSKNWTVIASDTKPPEPRKWRIEPPRARSRDTLSVLLDDPVASSAEALIAIRDPNGRRVPGRAQLDEGETVWHFVPSKPWAAGAYAVVAHSELEDPAGNRPCIPFEAAGASRATCDTSAALIFFVGQAISNRSPRSLRVSRRLKAESSGFRQ